MATHPASYGQDDMAASRTTIGARLSGAAPVMRAVLRIGAGLLFMQHGAQKLLGMFGGVDGQGATVELMTQYGLAGVLELGGGFLIVIGLFTRPVAMILVIEMIAAYVLAHIPQGAVPIQNGGELALLYALVWAYLAAAGPGAVAVDSALTRSRS
ncbi:MAG TPA: DoxX family protein [Longimicrobiales bacterium]|nr:DoxX family protein [Longimicrobiales bacterium]